MIIASCVHRIEVHLSSVFFLNSILPADVMREHANVRGRDFRAIGGAGAKAATERRVQRVLLYTRKTRIIARKLSESSRIHQIAASPLKPEGEQGETHRERRQHHEHSLGG